MQYETWLEQVPEAIKRDPGSSMATVKHCSFMKFAGKIVKNCSNTHWGEQSRNNLFVAQARFLPTSKKDTVEAMDRKDYVFCALLWGQLVKAKAGIIEPKHCCQKACSIIALV